MGQLVDVSFLVGYLVWRTCSNWLTSFFTYFSSGVLVCSLPFPRPRNLTRSQAIVTVIIASSSRGLEGMLSCMLVPVTLVPVVVSVSFVVIPVTVDVCQNKPHWPYRLPIFPTLVPCP